MAAPGCVGGGLSPERGLASLLLVSPFAEDRVAVERALDGAAWQIYVARDFGEALDVLDAQEMASVICDADVRTGDWRELLRVVNESAARPPFILASNRADEYLWAEVLNLGGYDVLPKPFDAKEIDRVLDAARAVASRHPRQAVIAVPCEAPRPALNT